MGVFVVDVVFMWFVYGVCVFCDDENCVWYVFCVLLKYHTKNVNSNKFIWM